MYPQFFLEIQTLNRAGTPSKCGTRGRSLPLKIAAFVGTPLEATYNLFLFPLFRLKKATNLAILFDKFNLLKSGGMTYHRQALKTPSPSKRFLLLNEVAAGETTEFHCFGFNSKFASLPPLLLITQLFVNLMKLFITLIPFGKLLKF